MKHLFSECPEIKNIWYRVVELFLKKYNVSIVFDNNSITSAYFLLIITIKNLHSEPDCTYCKTIQFFMYIQFIPKKNEC